MLLIASYITKGNILLFSINTISTIREYKASKELDRAKQM